MKFINKFLNIVNIVSIVVFIILPIMSNDFFEVTIRIFKAVVYVLLGIINLIVGIKNLKNNNKKIGIFSIVLSVVLIAMCAFSFLYQIKIEDVYGYLNGSFKILAIILSIIILVANRKAEDNLKAKSFIISICFTILIEIVFCAIVIIFASINKANIEKAMKILSEDPKKQIITYEWIDNNNETNCDFYNSNGQLISSKKYKILYKNSYQTQAHNIVNVLIVNESNKTWIVNSEGEKIIRLFNMFENVEKSISFYLASNNIIKDLDYEYLGISNYKKINLLKLQKSDNNSFLFGDFTIDGYQLNVVLNNNELETDTKLKKIYYEQISWYNNHNSTKYSEEQLDIINNMYKYKKYYYLIGKNGERKKIDCNNIFFTFDNQRELAVWTYSNMFIPFYDNEKNGYIDTNGDIFSLPKKYIVYDAVNSYKTVYDYEKGVYYILSHDNKLLINETPKHIVFQNDNYLVTDEYAYIIQNNNFKKISNNKHSNNKAIVDSVNFIDVLDSNNTPLPYDTILPFDELSLYSQ